MSDYVPQEVWMNIFARLPVKALLQIRSVCKFFHAIISSPSFILDHINSAKKNRIPVFRYLSGQRVSERKEHYLLLPDDDDMDELDFPFKSKSFKHFQVAGSCNGLFCLSDNSRVSDSAYGIILWNPSIKKYVGLPKPRVTSRSHRVDCVEIGFGFDCKTDDYKVVRIAILKDRAMGPHVELYSVKSGSWKDLYAGVPLAYEIWSFCYSTQTYKEGCVHWVGYSTARSKNRDLIVSFDFSNEEFKEVNLPDDLQEWSTDLTLGVLWEKLAAVQHHSWRRKYLTVWIMDEYGVAESWRKMYDVNMWCEGLTFVGFTNNGEVLVEITTNRKLVLYDPNDTSTTRVAVRGAKNSYHMEMYMESLVLLDGESATMQSEAITCGNEAW